jgi:hypothetical protein
VDISVTESPASLVTQRFWSSMAAPVGRGNRYADPRNIFTNVIVRSSILVIESVPLLVT